MTLKVIIVGGGAAGFFAAITCKANHPNAEVILLEKTSKLLSKVKISGGGRCNVTHDCLNNSQLVRHYPRGEKFLKKAFNKFSVKETINWFQNEGVKLKVEDDGRMFPVTDNSSTIINALLNKANQLGVKIITRWPVDVIKNTTHHFTVSNQQDTMICDKLVIAVGGHGKPQFYEHIASLGHNIIPPVPSLFTFNIPRDEVTNLMGVAVSNAQVKVANLRYNGPLLITHWGMSGPAVLKTSAWGARLFHEKQYQTQLRIDWLADYSENDLRMALANGAQQSSKRKLVNYNYFKLPQRLWDYIITKAAIREDITLGELGSKGLNRLLEVLKNDHYAIDGKTTFKEEFVTCGGVNCTEVDPNTMQSRIVDGLYFAGEVLDIEGVTGRFNFQAAWTTGYIAGQLG